MLQGGAFSSTDAAGWLVSASSNNESTGPRLSVHSFHHCLRKKVRVDENTWVSKGEMMLDEFGALKTYCLSEPEAPHPKRGCGKIPPQKYPFEGTITVGGVCYQGVLSWKFPHAVAREGDKVSLRILVEVVVFEASPWRRLPLCWPIVVDSAKQ